MLDEPAPVDPDVFENPEVGGGCTAVVNSIDPQLESAWFQTLNLKCDILVSYFNFLTKGLPTFYSYTEALKDARNRLRRLLLSTHPDKFPAEGGERAQAQAATQIIMRLMKTLDAMLA